MNDGVWAWMGRQWSNFFFILHLDRCAFVGSRHTRMEGGSGNLSRVGKARSTSLSQHMYFLETCFSTRDVVLVFFSF
ncbi:hypothetical protein VTL71DRAFT_8107 [Oculimacula yallundae]|uniref:Secreted protein n=1 Tax=Oculimacula yallundae TaxID=86028 RepID=A0ABR4CZ28_9HELO